MRLRVLMVLALFATVFPARESFAQMSSLMTISPYTMYGLGDFSAGGSAFNRSMGGIGTAYRNPYNYNYVNPAALNVTPPRQHAIFNFGAIGQNFYLKNAESSNSYNTFTIHDVGLAFPLGPGIGFGFSLNPVSSVGYVTRAIDDNPEIIENVGGIIYDYAGDGGITQLSASLGVQVLPGLSLGASMHYWFGSIERQYNASVGSYLGTGSYRALVSTENTNISKLLFTLGMQYSFVVGNNNALTLGATYQPKVVTSARYRQSTINLSSTAVDTVSWAKTRQDITIPEKISGGIFYQSSRFSAGFDYTRQNWNNNSIPIPVDQDIAYRAQEDYKIGFSYTPNRYDIRNALNRWTYKIGARYSNSYLVKGGYGMHDVAFTLGIDFPLKRHSLSNVGMGIELGQRGHTRGGQIREQYFRYFLALSLFGDDYWFVRRRYN